MPPHRTINQTLQQSLLKSLQWNEDLLSGKVCSIDALIARDNLNPRQVHRLRNLAFLVPDIMDRIIATSDWRNRCWRKRAILRMTAGLPVTVTRTPEMRKPAELAGFAGFPWVVSAENL